jgi:lipoyl(octanoyl) transferase
MKPPVGRETSGEVVGLYLADGPRSGPENMLCDQLMLEQAAATNRPLVRFYTWLNPTLSLGYFQKYGDRQQHLPSREIDVVRRATGGGAIVHHHDWTYAVAVPTSLLGAATRSQSSLGASQHLYDAVHRAVVAWLQEFGWDARMWDSGCAAATSARSGCSFLCFERRSQGDIVVGDAKVMGSAQRRIDGALLQHGSLLLRCSPHAPSLAGLRELPGGSFADELLGRRGLVEPAPEQHDATEHAHEQHLNRPASFQQCILASLNELLGGTMSEISAIEQLLPKAGLHAENRFCSDKWTLRL